LLVATILSVVSSRNGGNSVLRGTTPSATEPDP
jgi:hypothetical protein